MDIKDVIFSLRLFFNRRVKTFMDENGYWSIEGLTDIHGKLYRLPYDTKLLSACLEIQIVSNLMDWAKRHGWELQFPEHQNYYPDVTLIKNKWTFALDVKTTYRIDGNPAMCNGFTLGTYQAYFRDRIKGSNIHLPYKSYDGHVVLGVIYTRGEYLRDLDIIIQEKWKIAGDKPGSGNTKNMGSIRVIEDLVHGRGPFVSYGQRIFDLYWMNYPICKRLSEFIYAYREL